MKLDAGPARTSPDEVGRSGRYHAERNSSASPVDNPEQLLCSLRDNFVVLFTPLALKLLSH